MFGIKKRIPVMQAPRFFAAYSTHPFTEEKDKARYPDYAFERLGGMYWCVRIGDIDVPFGFGKRIASFRASGLVTLTRRNVSAATVDGLGLPRVQVGEICYFFEERYGNESGFIEFMQDRLTPEIAEAAAKLGPDGFRDGIREALLTDKTVGELLDAHQMELKAVAVETLSVD